MSSERRGLNERTASARSSWVMLSRALGVGALILAVLVMLAMLCRANLRSYVELAPYLDDRQPVETPAPALPSAASAASEGQVVVAADLRSGLVERGARGYFGQAVSLLRSATEDSGVEARVVGLPTLLSLKEIERGRPMLALVYGGGREGVAQTQEPLLTLPLFLYARADRSLVYDGVESLRRWRVGLVDGDRYGAELSDYLDTVRTDRERVYVARGKRAFERLVDALFLGRVDVMVASPEMIERSARALGVDPARFAALKGGYLGSWELHLVYSKSAPESVRRLADAVTDWARGNPERSQVAGRSRGGAWGPEERSVFR